MINEFDNIRPTRCAKYSSNIKPFKQHLIKKTEPHKNGVLKTNIGKTVELTLYMNLECELHGATNRIGSGAT